VSDGVDIYTRSMAPDALECAVAEAIAELDGREGDELREYVAWFRRRYPSPLERLAYCRRKYKEAMATQRAARRPLEP